MVDINSEDELTTAIETAKANDKKQIGCRCYNIDKGTVKHIAGKHSIVTQDGECVYAIIELNLKSV